MLLSVCALQYDAADNVDLMLVMQALCIVSCKKI